MEPGKFPATKVLCYTVGIMPFAIILMANTPLPSLFKPDAPAASRHAPGFL